LYNGLDTLLLNLFTYVLVYLFTRSPNYLIPVLFSLFSMSIITLTTDFGIKDGFIGTMKGVIWSICPTAQIADISHAIAPQNVLEGALVLWRAHAFFPPGTVHVAVVDPGVGTRRRALAARIGEFYFVGPDNGLFTPEFEQAEKNGLPMEIVHLTNEKYFLSQVSRTFHGRDIFAPVGAHLANGVALAELGPAINDPVRLQMPKPEKTPSGWRAHIIWVDHFGNLATDLPGDMVMGHASIAFHLRGRTVRGLVAAYGDKGPGELVALVDSENYVEIAVVNGNAAQSLGARVGDEVEVIVDG
jgi:S-adenosylmethionine hydrolase